MKYLMVGVAVFVITFAITSLLFWLGIKGDLTILVAAVVGFTGAALIRRRLN